MAIIGKLLRVNGAVITDTTAPKLITRDPIEAKGSLMLFDGQHDFAPFTGLPAVAAQVPNALANLCQALTGASGEDLNFKVQTARPDSAQFKSERTAKGGIHGIVTQSGSQTATETYMLYGPKAVSDYILAHPTHQFYFSLWSLVTRAGLTSLAGQSPFHYTNGVAATTNNLFHMQAGLPSPGFPSAPSFRGTKAVPSYSDHNVAVVPPMKRFGCVSVQGFTGTPPSAADRVQLGVGTFSAWNTLNYNICPSRIIYRGYAEDLTASGRTYAEVEALDYAMFQAAFAPGGKFYGDTFTSPTTLP